MLTSEEQEARFQLLKEDHSASSKGTLDNDQYSARGDGLPQLVGPRLLWVEGLDHGLVGGGPLSKISTSGNHWRKLTVEEDIKQVLSPW